MSPQKKATLISSCVAAALTIIKLSVGLLSGSVALLASAIDSVLDFFVSIFNYFAIKNSEKPADKRFNYGRGKIEALASVIEGTIIAVSGLFLLYQAVKKYINGDQSLYLDISLIVMVISLIITIGLVTYLNKVAKETNSMVIKADALHYKTDIYSNVAVLVSLLLIQFTGYEIFDIVIGAGISLYIIYSAYELIQEGVLILLDRSLDEEIVNNIKTIITESKRVNTYHMLKTREAGQQTYVDVHLVFDTNITLLSAHKASDDIEFKIKELDRSKDWILGIHLDPYDDSIINNEH